MAHKKEHCVTVTIASTSGDSINQKVILEEYASTAEELVYKNHAIADATMLALNNCMKELSSAFLGGNQPNSQATEGNETPPGAIR